MQLAFAKTANGGITCADQVTREFVAQRVKTGQILHGNFTRMRNYAFHQKFWALMGLGFDVWSETAPRLIYCGEEVHPTLDGFRKNVTVLAGWYDMYTTLKGEVRLEAKSISFGNMDQEEFEALYSKCIDIILSRVLNDKMDADALRNRVDQVLEFDK